MKPRRGRPRILVIDDQSRTAEALGRLLAAEVELVHVRSGAASRPHARSWREAEPLLDDERHPLDAVVLDVRFDLPDEDLLPDERPLGDDAAARRRRKERRERQGIYILERLRRRRPDLPVLLTTAYEDIAFEEAALTLRADAFTYAVGEDEASSEGVVRALRRLLEERDSPPRTGRFYWGSSTAMRELRRKVSALAPTPMPLLITGPTGTGKSLLARDVVHALSGRSGAFVSFDCATVPEGLLQAALFGTLRGAFTGAIADRPGVFEAAAEGTLFLDEIENLTPDAQKMLLTAVNDGKIRRLGATAEIPHTARLVAASNADLGRRAKDGTFRSDLLMRLNPSLALELPRLTERREDLPELARATAGAFFDDTRHRRAIAALVRASGGPEPAATEEFDAGALGGRGAEGGGRRDLRPPAQGLGRDGEASLAGQRPAVRDGGSGCARGGRIRRWRGVDRPIGPRAHPAGRAPALRPARRRARRRGGGRSVLARAAEGLHRRRVPARAREGCHARPLSRGPGRLRAHVRGHDRLAARGPRGPAALQQDRAFGPGRPLIAAALLLPLQVAAAGRHRRGLCAGSGRARGPAAAEALAAPSDPPEAAIARAREHLRAARRARRSAALDLAAADLAFAGGDIEEGGDLLAAAAEADPKAALSAGELYLLARRAEERRRWREAMFRYDALRRVLAAEGETAPWIGPRIRELELEARAAAIAPPPSGPPAEARLALADAKRALARGQLDDARAKLLLALKLSPGYAEALLALSAVETRAGRPAAAIKAAREALAAEPDRVETLTSLASLLWAEPDRKAKEEALVFSDRAAALRPGEPALLRVAAERYAELGDAPRALERLDRYIAKASPRGARRGRLAPGSAVPAVGGAEDSDAAKRRGRTAKSSPRRPWTAGARRRCSSRAATSSPSPPHSTCSPKRSGSTRRSRRPPSSPPRSTAGAATGRPPRPRSCARSMTIPSRAAPREELARLYDEEPGRAAEAEAAWRGAAEAGSTEALFQLARAAEGQRRSAVQRSTSTAAIGTRRRRAVTRRRPRPRSRGSKPPGRGFSPAPWRSRSRSFWEAGSSSTAAGPGRRSKSGSPTIPRACTASGRSWAASATRR